MINSNIRIKKHYYCYYFFLNILIKNKNIRCLKKIYYGIFLTLYTSQSMFCILNCYIQQILWYGNKSWNNNNSNIFNKKVIILTSDPIIVSIFSY